RADVQFARAALAPRLLLPFLARRGRRIRRLADQRLAQVHRARRDHRVVQLARGLRPVGEELLAGDAHRALDGVLDADHTGGHEVAHHRLVTEARADVSHQRLAVAIGEVAGIAGQLADVREAIVDRGVADPQ